MYNYCKLRGKIREKFSTQYEFAKALGIGSVSLSKKLNGEIDFSQSEINKSVEVLDLKKDDIPNYFFISNV